jgi:hypothetical protein
VVEESADLLSSAIYAVGVPVEESEEHLLAPFAVTGLASGARPPGDRLDGAGRLGGLVDTDLAEPVVNGAELAVSPQEEAVKLADRVGRVVERAVVLRWWEEEPDQGGSKASAKARISCGCQGRLQAARRVWA